MVVETRDKQEMCEFTAVVVHTHTHTHTYTHTKKSLLNKTLAACTIQNLQYKMDNNIMYNITW
jgi:hypothetical protein